LPNGTSQITVISVKLNNFLCPSRRHATKFWSLGLAFTLIAAQAGSAEERIHSSAAQPYEKSIRTADVFGKVALAFVANSGQLEEQVKFIARGAGGSLFLTRQGAVLSLRATEKPDSRQSGVRMTMVGADPHASIEGLEILPGKSNFFIGNDRRKWRTDVPNYGKVRYRDAWPGIDVVYYGNQRQVEYDFTLKPHADPDRISLRFEGADRIEIDRSGELILHTPGGEIRQHKPVIFQQVGGVVGQDRVRFQLAKCDPARPLVIDRLWFVGETVS